MTTNWLKKAIKFIVYVSETLFINKLVSYEIEYYI